MKFVVLLLVVMIAVAYGSQHCKSPTECNENCPNGNAQCVNNVCSCNDHNKRQTACVNDSDCAGMACPSDKDPRCHRESDSHGDHHYECQCH